MEYSVCREHWTKKKSESPTGIKPMTSSLILHTYVCSYQSRKMAFPIEVKGLSSKVTALLIPLPNATFPT